MSELYEKSLHKLELDQVLQLLAECAGSTEGKAACLKLRPSSDLDDVRRSTGAYGRGLPDRKLADGQGV